MIAEVIVDISNCEVDRVFDYLLDDDEEKGAGYRVMVPFGNRRIEGYILRVKSSSELAPEKLKPIDHFLDTYPVISPEMLVLLDFMIARYHLKKVDALRLFLPAEMRGGRVKELVKSYAYIADEYKDKDPAQFIKKSATAQAEIFTYLLENPDGVSVTEINSMFSAAALRNLVTRGVAELKDEQVMRTPYKNIIESCKKVALTPAQVNAVDTIMASSGAKGRGVLLHGVTGSGKTEVYMDCIGKTLLQNKTAIMLVPEISLTPQVLGSFRSRFGDKVAILHSGLSAGERFDEWRRLISGEAVIAVGARSAVFAPLKNVGIIIIDEEHDSSYISETNPRYATIEIAQKRAQYNGAALVLGSATPSIESYQKTRTKEYTLIEMPDRVNSRALPEINVVNMCREVQDGNPGVFSRALEVELKECMDSENQAIVFINRRGYSSFFMCRSCGYVAKCSQCDVSLVYHRDENVLKCHYCGNRFAALTVCPECKSEHIRYGYMGTEKVAEELARMFPGKKILRMDNDTTRTKDAHLKILSEFAATKSSILVGTQMIAKGHDFPDVTLVGIVDADMSLHFADYRSGERTYQLITQVSGRAGRDKKPGKVVLQTYTPGHYVYKFAVRGDYKGFFEKEANLREVTKYPPFSDIIRILVTSSSEAKASEALKAIYDDVSQLRGKMSDIFYYLGAMRAPLKRLQSKYRMQILMRLAPDSDDALQGTYAAMDRVKSSDVSIFVEINPSNLS